MQSAILQQARQPAALRLLRERTQQITVARVWRTLGSAIGLCAGTSCDIFRSAEMEDPHGLKAAFEAARRDVEAAQARVTEVALHRTMLERMGRPTFTPDEVLEKLQNELAELRATRDFAEQRLKFVRR